MLSKKYRLSKKEDFDRVFKQGVLFFTNNLKVRYLKNKLPSPRFAVVTSAKVNKSAVVRNRIRRIIKSELEKKLILLINSYDMVISVRPGLKLQKIPGLREEINYLLIKKGLISHD